MPECRAQLALPYGAHPRQVLDLVVPDRPVIEAVAVCLPGGWWSAHPPVGKAQAVHDLRPLILELAARGIPAAGVGHRLLGDGAAHGGDILADVSAALVRLAEEASLAGLPLAGGAALLGHGAGSLVALLAGQQPPAGAVIRAVVCAGLTPSLDSADGMPAHLRPALDGFAGADRAARNPMAMPVDRLPPTLILRGEGDGETPAKLAARFVARLAAAGIDHRQATIPGAGHQPLDHLHDKAGAAALDQIAPFLRAHCRPGGEAPIFLGAAAGR